MPEIINTYRETHGALRFIGMRYGDDDRNEDGSFRSKWVEFHKQEWFAAILSRIVGDPKDTCTDGDSYIGLMRMCEGEPFQYWIGMFTPPGTDIPDGLDFVDFEAGSWGVCWIFGKTEEVFFIEDRCIERLVNESYEVLDDSGELWCFERYADPRFTMPDDQGNVILDLCVWIR